MRAERSQALNALGALLVSLFRNDLNNLRYLLRRVPGYEKVNEELPDPMGLSPNGFMRKAVDWLEAEKLLRRPFFEALVGERPGREQEIRKVQRMLQRIILFVTATPEDLPALDVEGEARGIVQVLDQSFGDPSWAVVVAHRVTMEDLLPLLLRYQPDVLHFSGHGDVWGRIWVEKGDSGEDVPSGPLLRLVSSAKPPLQCVIWSACYSSRLASATVKAGLACAVGMTDAVNDATAIHLMHGFYQALSQGKGYAESLELGRIHADLHRLPGLETPVFFGDTSAVLRQVE